MIYFLVFFRRKKKNGNVSPEELRKNGEDYPENSGCPHCFWGLNKGVII